MQRRRRGHRYASLRPGAGARAAVTALATPESSASDCDSGSDDGNGDCGGCGDDSPSTSQQHAQPAAHLSRRQLQTRNRRRRDAAGELATPEEAAPLAGNNADAGAGAGGGGGDGDSSRATARCAVADGRPPAAGWVGGHRRRKSTTAGPSRRSLFSVVRTVAVWYLVLIPLGACFFAALYLGSTASPSSQSAAAGGNARSALLILIDDMRPVQSAYGQRRLGPWDTSFTPNLDRFAEGGLTFTRAYVQASLCSPSRTSFLTGARPDRTMVWNLLDDIRTINAIDRRTPPLWPVVTLPEYLRSQGYRTHGFGKVFHSSRPKSNDYPISFSERHAPLTTVTCKQTCGGKNSGEGGVLNTSFWQWGPGGGAVGGAFFDADPAGAATNMFNCLICPTEAEESTFEDYHAVNQAINTLRDHVETYGHNSSNRTPFFFVLGICKPHTPWRYPKKFMDMFPVPRNLTRPPLPYTNRFPGGDTNYLEWIRVQEIMTQIGMDNVDYVTDNVTAWQLRFGYYHASAFADEVVGRILDELERLGLADDTAVVILGDHGFHLGEQNMWAKRTLFERGTQVPLLLRSPWHPRTAGHATNAVVEAVDVAPTVLDLLGLLGGADSDSGGAMLLDGDSLVPLLTAIDAADPPAPDAGRAVLEELEAAEDAAAWGAPDGQGPLGTGAAFSQYARCGSAGKVDCDKIERSRFTYMGYSVRTSRWRYCEWYPWDRHLLAPIVDGGPTGADLFAHDYNDPMSIERDYENESVLDGADPSVVSRLSELLSQQFHLTADA